MKVKVIATLLLLAIAGCSTVGGSRGSSGMAGLECGAIGAGLSALICVVAGGDVVACSGAAAGGGLLAAGLCYTYAERVQKHRQELAGKEDDLDARLKYVKGLNEDTRKANEDLSKRVAQVLKHTDKVVAQIERDAISERDLAKEREALLKEEKVAKEQVALQQSDVADMKAFRVQLKRKSGADSAAHAELDKEIEKQQRLLAETQRQTRALATAALRL